MARKSLNFSKIELKVTANREEVQSALMWDSDYRIKARRSYTVKRFIPGQKRSGKLEEGQGRAARLLQKLKDPDAVNGQTERWSANKCMAQ